MKDKIICLVGESGSGKTTIAELLEKEGYNYIESYTTRPPRFEGERGHIFVNDFPIIIEPEEFSLEAIGKIGGIDTSEFIAYTFYNNYHYWASKQQYKGKGVSIYVIDVPGIKKLKQKVKDAEILVIYLKASKQTLLERMIVQRGMNKALERIKHDQSQFDIVPCDYVINTDKYIDEVLSLLKQIIGGLE